MLMVVVAMETLWIFSHGILKYGPPGWNHAHLRINVAVAFLRPKTSAIGIVERGLVAGTPLGAPEDGLHRALILIDGINPE